MLKQLTQNVNDLSNKYILECAKLNDSEEYKAKKADLEALQSQMDVIEDEIHAMKEPQRAALEEYNGALLAVREELEKEGVDSYEDFELKYSVKSKVDTAKFYNLTQDMDLVMTLATISQKDLKDYAKSQKDNGIKKAIEGCIVEVSRTVSGVKHASAVK